MTDAEKELENQFKKFIELYGWEKFEAFIQEQLGLVLVADTGIERTYARPDGKLKATFRAEAPSVGTQASVTQLGLKEQG